MTYDLRTALTECISVMTEQVEPGSGHPYEVLQRARKVAIINGWQPMSEAPLNKQLILVDPTRYVMTTWVYKTIQEREGAANEGWKLWQLAPAMPEVQS